MAKQNYEEGLRRLLLHEGGYTNHPSDPGGPTNFGITIHDYRKYVKPDATAADVKAMSLGQAKAIYRAKYWDAQKCDALPSGVDYAIFDYGVNSGIGRSGKVLRRVLGISDHTYVVTEGVVSIAAKADARKLVNDICDERLRFLKSLKTWRTFGNGWGRRVSEVRAAALVMASNVKAVAPIAIPSTGKGTVPESKAHNGAAAAIVVAGGAAAQQAHQAGFSIVTVVAIAVGAIALAALAYHMVKRRNAAKQEKAA